MPTAQSLPRLLSLFLSACCLPSPGGSSASGFELSTPYLRVEAGGEIALQGAYAHSHNDYLHTDALHGALDAGVLSIEADIFPIDGELYVAHERSTIAPGRTLRSMYLDPLYQRFQSFGGTVETLPFQGQVRESGLPVVLFIDIKAEGEVAYGLIESQLAEYDGLFRGITMSRQGFQVTEGPVVVSLTGSSPDSLIASRGTRRVGYDGGYPEALSSDTPAHLSPTVATSYSRLQQAAVSRGESLEQVMTEFADAARADGRLSRVWGGPDNQAAWDLQVSAGISLINTDQPKVAPGYLGTPAENDLTLSVDTSDGRVVIRNSSGLEQTLASYRIASFNGSLTGVQGWAPLTDNNNTAGWSVVEQGVTYVQEEHRRGDSIPADGARRLGPLFGGERTLRDLIFEYRLAGELEWRAGEVDYRAIEPQPGDFDLDGKVSAADYTLWRDNLGKESSVLNGGGHGGMLVSRADYEVWQDAYGIDYYATPGDPFRAMPESGTLCVAVVAVVCCTICSRRPIPPHSSSCGRVGGPR